MLMFCLSGDSVNGGGIVVKDKVFLLTFSEELGTRLETSTWEAQLTSFLPGSHLSFLKPYLPLRKMGNYKDTDWTKFVALHLFPDSVGLVSMEHTMEAERLVEKQRDPCLVFL